MFQPNRRYSQLRLVSRSATLSFSLISFCINMGEKDPGVTRRGNISEE